MSRHRLSFALGDDWTKYSFDYFDYLGQSYTGVYVLIVVGERGRESGTRVASPRESLGSRRRG